MKNKCKRAEVPLRSRRVYFRTTGEKYFYSGRYPGGKSDLLRAGSMDTCDREWPEVLEIFQDVKTLWDYFQALAKADGCYRFHEKTLRSYGVTIRSCAAREEIPPADLVYGILEGEAGVRIDETLSRRMKEEVV